MTNYSDVFENSDRLKAIILNGSYIIAEQNDKQEWVDKSIQDAPKNLKSGIYRLREAKPASDKVYGGVVIYADNKIAITAEKGRLIKHNNNEKQLKLGQNIKIDYSKSKENPEITLEKNIVHKSRRRL